MNVLLAVTGGIAAYKAPEIIRRLNDHGVDVRVVMTRSACEFVKPMVFQAVSGYPVHTNLLDEQAESGMGHIELARWADVLLVAPATANILARMATGFADDLLSTVCLATTAKQVVAPAMNRVMWQHSATQSNVETLKERGVEVLGPGAGSQACGETGIGRMLEPKEIVELVLDMHDQIEIGCILRTKRVLITAGPTREDIDPVRFISNHSSGKMGFALARAARFACAEVTLVAGPVSLDTPQGVTRLDVVSARDMHSAVMGCASDADIFISVAAVGDYRAAEISSTKIKKSSEDLVLRLQRNPDILAEVSSKQQRPFCVGFAAETENVGGYARDKLILKNLDMIVANRVGVSGEGFSSDSNAVEVFWTGGSQAFTSRSKQRLAFDLIKLIASRYELS